MKKLILILLCLPMIGFGQNTYYLNDNINKELPDHINLAYDGQVVVLNE